MVGDRLNLLMALCLNLMLCPSILCLNKGYSTHQHKCIKRNISSTMNKKVNNLKGRGLMKTSHLGLSTLKSLTPHIVQLHINYLVL